jgi:hypothetical protein
MWRIICHAVQSHKDSAPESILDTDDWLNWKGDLDNPDDSKEDCAADDEYELAHNN